MKKKLITAFALLTACLTVFSAIGCSASSAPMTAEYKAAADTNGIIYETTSPAYAEIAEELPEDAIYDADFEASVAPVLNADAGEKGSVTGSEQVSYGDKLVYTCRITLETTEFDTAVRAIREKIAEVGGFIAEETSTDDADRWYYDTYVKTGGTMHQYLEVRVPADQYEAFLASLDGHGRVVSKNMTAENITKRYRETETTIRSLEIQETRLLEMLEACDTVEDMITVEDRLSEVQGELEYYKNALSGMDMDVNYSTVYIDIQEVLEYKPEEDPVYTLTFGDRLKNTLSDSGKGFLSFLEGLLFFLIRALPILFVLFVFFGGIILLIVKLTKRRRQRKNRKEEKSSPVLPKHEDEPSNPHK